jgi:tetratricopeptide (TPR) repeat protein
MTDRAATLTDRAGTAGTARRAAGRGARPGAVGRLLAAALALACGGLAGAGEPAEKVNWRYLADYAKVRDEALKTGKPLLFYIAQEKQAASVKMEETTLHDPAIARLINQHFLAVKIDAVRDKEYVEQLKTTVVPRTFLTGADLHVYKMLDGYQEPARFREALQEGLTQMVSPEWMTRRHQDATQAVSRGHYPWAVALLRSVLEDNQNRPVQLQARKLLESIEGMAQTALRQAQQQEKAGQVVQAVEAYGEVNHLYAGTDAAAEAAKAQTALTDQPEVKLQLRHHRAAQMLQWARDDFRAQQFACCVDRCLNLTANYADLPEAAEAGHLLDQIKANTDWLRITADAYAERLGEMYLAQAENWLRKGEPQKARDVYQNILTTLPRSRHADVAKVRLAQIQTSGSGGFLDIWRRPRFWPGAKEAEAKPPGP